MKRAVLVVTLLLVACASASPPRTLYLLRADSTGAIGATGPAGRVEVPVRVGLDRVAVAHYLDQEGIVVETAAGQVQAARQHQWAEPLDTGLRSFLRAEISRQLGYEVSGAGVDRIPWDYSIDVYIDRLHGTIDGTALLDASYRINARTGEIAEYRFSATAPLPREGYAGLVEAEARLARELAAAIAASLRELGSS